MQEGAAEAKALQKQDPGVFASRTKALDTRLACLAQVHDGSLEGFDTYMKALKAACQGKSEEELRDSMPLPEEVLANLIPIRKLQECAHDVGKGVKCEKDLNASVNRIADMTKPINVLYTACKSALKGLATAKTAKEAHLRTRAQQLEKQRNATKARESKRTPVKVKGKASQHALFDLDLMMVQEMRAAKDSEPTADLDYSKPFKVEGSSQLQDISNNSGLKVNGLVFKAGLNRASSDRDMRVLASTSSGEIRARVLKHYGPPSQDLLLEDHKECSALLKQVYIWASKKGAESISTESASVGCMRLALFEGSEMFVLAFNAHEFKQYYMHVKMNKPFPYILLPCSICRFSTSFVKQPFQFQQLSRSVTQPQLPFNAGRQAWQAAWI